MASIHRLKLDSDILRSGSISPELIEELFRTVDESVSYEIEVADGVSAADLPGFGTAATAIATIQTFLLITDRTITLGWNGASGTNANNSLVVGTGQRRAIFLAYGVSTTTVPTVSNSSGGIAILQVVAGGT